MAELHSNQIAFSAPETAKANLAVGQDYISPALQAAAKTIETAAIQRAREDDVALASKVKSAMVAGEQDLRMGDSINGDYSALKNKALDRYQVAFEGAPASAIARYRQQNPNELDDYETGLTAIEAQRSIASADIRIKKEMPQWASAVALGQMSWEDAVAALHVMGGEFMTADKYEGYTFDLRSDIDSFQVNALLSGDAQSVATLIQRLQDPQQWKTLTAAQRAQKLSEAKTKLNGILKAETKTETPEKDETYNRIRNSFVNSLTDLSLRGLTDQLDSAKRALMGVAKRGYVDFIDPATGKPTRFNYTDLTPEQWGKIINEIEKIRTNNPQQQAANVEFRNKVDTATTRLEQGVKGGHMSDVVLADKMTADPKALGIYGEDELAKRRKIVAESYNNLATAMQAYSDINTPVQYSNWGHVLSGIAERGTINPYYLGPTAQRELQEAEKQYKARGGNLDTKEDAVLSAGIKFREGLNKNLKMMRSGSMGDFIKTAKSPMDADGQNILDLVRAPMQSTEYKIMQSFRDLIAPAKDKFYDGKHVAKIDNNSRAEYVLGLGAALNAKLQYDPEFATRLGFPVGGSIDRIAISKAIHAAQAVLEQQRQWNTVSTPETQKEDAKMLRAALGLDALPGAQTDEAQREWAEFAAFVGYGQVNNPSRFVRWLRTVPSQHVVNKEDNQIDLTWTANKKRG